MKRYNILVVDDEPDIREIISDILGDEGYNPYVAAGAAQARELFSTTKPDLVLLDIWMPDTDGISLLQEWMKHDRNLPVIMISGHGTVETAVEAIRLGAYDFLEKPLSIARLLTTVRRALQSSQLSRSNQLLRNYLEPSESLIGKSSAMRELRERIKVAAATDQRVLIYGETGTGRGVVARTLHRFSDRFREPLVELNLGANTRSDAPPELFGSEIGGVVTPGCLEDAQNSTLVLYNVANLDHSTQQRLDNAITNMSFTRTGGAEPVTLTARIITISDYTPEVGTTHDNLNPDLYAKLAEISIRVPPLREHSEDIPELSEYCLRLAIDRDGLPYRRCSTASLNALRGFNWPGNVRELNRVLQRALAVAEQEEISKKDIEKVLQEYSGDNEHALSFDGNLRQSRQSFERAYFLYHLKLVGGNMTELAHSTGVDRAHLYRKLKVLGIDPKTNFT